MTHDELQTDATTDATTDAAAEYDSTVAAPPDPIEQQSGRRWGFWATIGFGIVVALAFVLVQTVVVVAVLLWEMVNDPDFSMEQRIEGLEADGLVLGLSTVSTTIVGVGLIVLIVRLRRGASLTEYLSLRPMSSGTVLKVLGTCAAFMAVSDGVTMMLGRPVVSAAMVEAYRTAGSLPLMWVALVVGAPVFEEMFFRGFLFEGMRRSRLGDTGAIALTALGWTSIHLQYGSYELAVVFAGGVMLGIVRLRTGSLWAPMMFHALFNLIATVQTALASRASG